MKQEEKNRKSREHILEYAFGEFSEQGYQGASVNAICTAGKISKGLLYHYYADKDALYLACVEKCYQELTAALSAALKAETVTPDQYFDTRLDFFAQHPEHQRLFCDTVVNPPRHLRRELADRSDGAVSRLWPVLHDDDYLPDHRRIPVWAVPFRHSSGAFLYSLHSDSAQTVGSCRHLRLPAWGRYSDHFGLRFLDTGHEACRVQEYARNLKSISSNRITTRGTVRKRLCHGLLYLFLIIPRTNEENASCCDWI